MIEIKMRLFGVDFDAEIPEELRQNQTLEYDDEVIDAAMQSTEDVLVFKGRNFAMIPTFLGFEPKQNARGVCLIIYPGAFVKPEAYATIAKGLAERGYHATITNPPGKFQILQPWQGLAVLRYTKWMNCPNAYAVAGHSAGGVAAALFAWTPRMDALKGLVLLASYPGPNTDLSDFTQETLKVSSVSGTNDALTTPEKVEESKVRLPDHTKYIPIEGGNHTQFYAAKKGFLQPETSFTVGDNPADISSEKQLEAIVNACCDMLEDMAE